MLKVVVRSKGGVRHSGQREYQSEPAAKQPRSEMSGARPNERCMKCKEAGCRSPRPHETGTLREVLHLAIRNPILNCPFLPAWHSYRIPLPIQSHARQCVVEQEGRAKDT